MIALHPQPSPGRPDEIRWILPAGTLPFTGEVATAPAPLGALLDDGTLGGVRLEPGAVVTTLAPGRTWPEEGARVRTAVHGAAGQPGAWQPAFPGSGEGGGSEGSGPDGTGDGPLRAAVEVLLAGEVGDLARSHGGSIELISVENGLVHVRMTGACDGCPAASATLRVRLEAELRRAHPGLRGVVAQAAPGFPQQLGQRARALISWPTSARAVPNHSSGTSTGPRRLARMNPQ